MTNATTWLHINENCKSYGYKVDAVKITHTSNIDTFNNLNPTFERYTQLRHLLLIMNMALCSECVREWGKRNENNS